MLSLSRCIKDGIEAGAGLFKEKKVILKWLSFTLKFCCSCLQQLSFLFVSLLVLFSLP